LAREMPIKTSIEVCFESDKLIVPRFGI